MLGGRRMFKKKMIAYLIATAIVAVRAGELGVWAAVARTGLFLIVMPLASLAILIPRLTFIVFFSSRRRHTRCGRDWSSDVCSSDLSDDVERRNADDHQQDDRHHDL